ncbi:alpha/beta hydrolase [Brevibacterium daeguense]
MADLQAAADARGPEAWIAAFGRFVPGPHRTADEVGSEVVAHLDTLVRGALQRHVFPLMARGRLPVRATPIENVNERRADIAVPVLALTGGGDAEDNIRSTRELLDLLPRSREVVIPRAGHYPNLEDAESFNSALAEFLRTC